MMYGPWMWWGAGMMLFWIVFPMLVVVGIVWAVRSFSSGTRSGRSDSSRALEILDERFARGELDQKEYEERRHLLSGGRSSSS